jgi:hypothetical protein
MKLQDDHNCLSLKSTTNHDKGGVWTEVMGLCVCVKLWIHFIAGDSLRHNNLVEHMNGGWPKFIYQDCKCIFDELSNPIQKMFSHYLRGIETSAFD